MPKYIRFSLGLGFGALIYELFVRGLHEARWGRVAFFVLFSLPIFWLIYRSREKKAADQA